ncbi:epoxide hydrolase N-terminal domain-containing protein [Streptomyces sp. NBC_00996]|uniref:epoxide hydrolase N-terminal domain-containing protein n=1 Tax=Streptomyces sp. NBC_00996 TaxID=2903710 RepID=UPI003864C685|nr:epoxide hydrolase N-terminal domain-containing protein [Streptomyces sp. NBC_00996]
MSVAPQNPAIRPFTFEFPEAELEDLRARIVATRWPEKETVADQSQGTQLETMKELARYWASEYDWRKAEAKLKALPQFVTEIDGLDIHFIHVRSKHENALPLIVTHGWPGSIIEQLKIIEPLTNTSGLPEQDFRATFPTVRAGAVLAPDASGMPALLESVRHPEKDTCAEARTELKLHLLGPSDPPSVVRRPLQRGGPCAERGGRRAPGGYGGASARGNPESARRRGNAGQRARQGLSPQGMSAGVPGAVGIRTDSCGEGGFDRESAGDRHGDPVGACSVGHPVPRCAAMDRGSDTDQRGACRC